MSSDPNEGGSRSQAKRTKRKRSTSTPSPQSPRSPAATTARSRPPPPPPPPASLVRLLRSDPSVVQYFQSLQANLEADVGIWKGRATKWKGKYEGLLSEGGERKSERLRRQKGKGVPKCSTNGKTSNAEETKNNDEKNPPPQVEAIVNLKSNGRKLIQSHDEGEPIDDSMFQFSSSSSTSSSSSDDDGDGLDKKSKAESTESEDAKTQREGKRKLFLLLKEAYDSLERLGIPLMKEVVPPGGKHEATVYKEQQQQQEATDEKLDNDANFGVQESEEIESDDTVDRVLVPRSTKEVATSILSCIHNATRAKLMVLQEDEEEDAVEAGNSCRRVDLGMEFPPFNPNNSLLPGCDATLAARNQTRSLSYTDVCSTNTNQQEKPHPAVAIRRALFRALLILDAFCTRNVMGAAWDSLFDDSIVSSLPATAFEGKAAVGDAGCTYSSTELMRIGLENRKDVVQHLVDLLQREACEGWACADRSALRKNVSLRLQRVDYLCQESREYQEGEDSAVLLGGQRSNARLSSLLERYWLAQLVSGIQLSRNDHSSAANLVQRYILSTVPAMNFEKYPEMPPVMSLVVLRGLLLPDLQSLGWTHQSRDKTDSCWFLQQLRGEAADEEGEQKKDISTFCRVMSHCIHQVAQIWKDRLRLSYNDFRNHDVAQVELASYRDLLRSESACLCKECGDIEKELHSLRSLFSSSAYVTTSTLLPSALRLAFVLHGNFEDTKSLLTEILFDATSSSQSACGEGKLKMMVMAAGACRQLMLRRLDSYIGEIGQQMESSVAMPSLVGFVDKFAKKAHMMSNNRWFWKLASAVLDCAATLADGSAAAQTLLAAFHWSSRNSEMQISTEEAEPWKAFNDSLFRIASTPTVRVIHLERRKDRLNAFLAQALRENVLFVLSVEDLKGSEPALIREETPYLCCGRYAFDGFGRMVEAYERLSNEVGGLSNMKALVNPQWCPNDLKPFDKGAPDDEGLAQMSGGEVACALSHVASWKGVIRSLNLHYEDDRSFRSNTLFRHPERLRRLFQIAGFAEGKAFHSHNENIPPTPVCVILEDDAILVDRFGERLMELLKVLPRDFHFCSIGYGRPKSAPILPYNELCGIPSHLFYLTGYILSAAGASFLLESLPVKGPVDSWIGLKMTSNWDNVFGTSLGVGIHAKPNSKIARKDLRQILRFRAFCSLQPLCSQRVGIGEGPGGRSWRQRDSDIEYSGDRAHARIRRADT